MSALEAVGLHRRAWAVWCAVRVHGVLSLYAFGLVDHDLTLYASWARAWSAGRLPYVDVPVEYPPGILPFLQLPASTDLQYAVCFVALALAADAAVLALLRRSGRSAGATLWLALPLLLGPLTWCRTDVFVALALVGAVEALRARHASLAALAVVAAGSLKLWPLALLAIALPVVPAALRWRFLLAGGASSLAVLTAIGWAGGLPGLRWMLEYHADRGLQAETLAAAPLHLVRLLGADLSVVQAYGSVEFPAAEVGPVLLLCNLALCAGVAACAVLAAAAARRGNGDLVPVVLGLTLVVAASGKVLSAQYAVWIIAAVALAIDRSGRRGTLLVSSGAVLLSTQYVFPFTFGGILSGAPTAVLALLVHGAAVAWLCGLGLRELVPGPTDRLRGRGGDAEGALASR